MWKKANAGIQHTDNENHISAVQSRMEERAKGKEGSRGKRTEMETFLPYKCLGYILTKVYFISYASVFPDSPAGQSFRTSSITHSQASNSIGRTQTDAHTHTNSQRDIHRFNSVNCPWSCCKELSVCFPACISPRDADCRFSHPPTRGKWD